MVVVMTKLERDASSMPTCKRCGIVAGSQVPFNRETQRCIVCDTAVQQSLITFREAFLHLTRDGIFTPEKWKYLSEKYLTEGGINGLYIGEALAYIRTDVLQFLDHMLTNAISKGPTTDEIEQHIRQLIGGFVIPNDQAKPLLRRIVLLNINQGKFPKASSQKLQGIHMDSDETCYLFDLTLYLKENVSSKRSNVYGDLMITNKKFRFLSASGGIEVGWNSVMRIEKREIEVTLNRKGKEVLLPVVGIYLELNKKSGNGFYGPSTSDPEIVVAMIDTLVRMAKRQIVKTDDNNSRRIPQDVRIAVWQRDQGKCVQCGARDYLEYDHIIPYSKGGATTVNNMQLLCRRCNQAKRDLI